MKLFPGRQAFLGYSLTAWLILLVMFPGAGFPQDRLRSDHWQSRNGLFEQELDSIPRNGVVFLGNSITEGFELEVWFPGQDYLNRGIAADHLDGLLERLDNSATGLEPAKLFIMIGINDIGAGRDNTYLKSMFTVLVDTLKQALPGTEIYIHSILPTTARWKNCPPRQIRKVNRFLAKLAHKRDLVFVDLHPLFLDGRNYLAQQYTRDGLHLNQEGYAVWVKEIEGYLLD